MSEFEAAVDVGVPLLRPFLTLREFEEDIPARAEDAEAKEAAKAPAGTPRTKPRRVERQQASESSDFTFSTSNGRHRVLPHWTFVWMSLAAAVLLTIALGVYAYHASHRGPEQPAQAEAGVSDRLAALEAAISDAGHDREALRAELAKRDGTIQELRWQIEEQSGALAESKSAESAWARSLQTSKAETEQAQEDRSNLSQKAEKAEASREKAQAELDALRQKNERDESLAASLKAQIDDLHAQLREREQDISRQEELLAHDRDVRELMGARDLYIAEIYDVGRDGTTQKPYGRVFYTKGKSLVFYAYDLDRQAGFKSASTFQAWGTRGSDREQAANLGIFYQDSSAKKRWVVKCDNAKTLEQIDAVFVTVEPSGGSHKPSGKPLLFAYLKLVPNHP